ncbi:hypothetical protein HNQ34_002114 [Anoxybacillus tepidamans]|uniref:Uncharacterized protein n=1 Tax=Anoxybacteroides tepidamans TaxID=265948 RepID=A0A7W8IQT8_9BACL|nr:hypothetical protein [Anoxybacillus tepidamans]
MITEQFLIILVTIYYIKINIIDNDKIKCNNKLQGGKKDGI